MDFKEKMYRGLESIAKWKSVYGSMRGRAYRVAEKAEAEAEKIEVDHYEAREWNALSAEEKEAVRQKRIDDEEMQEAMELYSARERALKAQVSADASTANVCEGDAVSPEKGQTEA